MISEAVDGLESQAGEPGPVMAIAQPAVEVAVCVNAETPLLPIL